MADQTEFLGIAVAIVVGLETQNDSARLEKDQKESMSSQRLSLSILRSFVVSAPHLCCHSCFTFTFTTCSSNAHLCDFVGDANLNTKATRMHVTFVVLKLQASGV